MATLILDIETVAPEWADLPSITRSALTHPIEASDAPEGEKERRRQAARSRLALSPFTGTIAALAVHDIERRDTTTYVVADTDIELPEASAATRLKVRSEKVLLEEFWEGARGYEVFVTFNGRAFTLPFLWFRSLAHEVRPSVDIGRQRYLTKQAPPYHVDLLDEFSNYGGLAHRPSLALLCGAFNLPNPSVLGGDEIAAAYENGEYLRVAEKAAGDVETIAALYERWLTHLAPRSFVNAVENL